MKFNLDLGRRGGLQYDRYFNVIFGFSFYYANAKKTQIYLLSRSTKNIVIHLGCGARVLLLNVLGNDSILFIVSKKENKECDLPENAVDIFRR